MNKLHLFKPSFRQQRKLELSKSLLKQNRFQTTWKTRVAKLTQSKPRLYSPGGSHSLFSEVSEEIGTSLATRIPMAIILLYCLNHEEYSPIPFAFDFMAGPSMLPTIFPAGDCYLRLKPWFLSVFHKNDKDVFEVGDIIVFKDFRGGYACKRICGIEGDKICIYGEYVDLYKNEPDLGIREVPNIEQDAWKTNVVCKDGKSTMIIPKGNIWVEGDNPLHSIDSRHYGPISKQKILGKVSYRIWPRQRIHVKDDFCFMDRKRPAPLSEDEMFGKKYNVYKIPFTK